MSARKPRLTPVVGRVRPYADLHNLRCPFQCRTFVGIIDARRPVKEIAFVTMPPLVGGQDEALPDW